MFWVSRHIFHLAVKMSHCRIHGAFYFEVSTLYLSLGRQNVSLQSTWNILLLGEYIIPFTWHAECHTIGDVLGECVYLSTGRQNVSLQWNV